MAETFYGRNFFFGRDFLWQRIFMVENFYGRDFSSKEIFSDKSCRQTDAPTEDKVSNYLHLYSLSYQTNFIMKFVLMDHPSVSINKAIKDKLSKFHKHGLYVRPLPA
jgi:hypothetical protein